MKSRSISIFSWLTRKKGSFSFRKELFILLTSSSFLSSFHRYSLIAKMWKMGKILSIFQQATYFIWKDINFYYFFNETIVYLFIIYFYIQQNKRMLFSPNRHENRNHFHNLQAQSDRDRSLRGLQHRRSRLGLFTRSYGQSIFGLKDTLRLEARPRAFASTAYPLMSHKARVRGCFMFHRGVRHSRFFSP